MIEQLSWGTLELRDASGDGRTVVGVAVPYNEVTIHAPRGPERFVPGVFKRSIEHRAGRPIKVLRNHDTAVPIGLGMLQETPGGLLVEVRLADTDAGRAAASEVAEQMLDSFSVGFRAIRERVNGGVRELLEAALAEVSLVPVPAYDGARVLAVRSAATGSATVCVPPRPQVDMSPLRIGDTVWC